MSTSIAATKATLLNLKGRGLIYIASLTRDDIHAIFAVASNMRQAVLDHGGMPDLLRGRLLATLFYEPSTRTSASFAAAMQRLGGGVIAVTDVGSSIVKGETLEDTVRTLSSYCDMLVLRHPEIGAAKRAADVLSIPVFNAGDGAGEHPTQALLDCFTILAEFGRLDNITITMVGDLKHGRTVHSLLRVLCHFSGVIVQYVCPETLAMPDYLQSEVAEKIQQSTLSLVEALPTTDVLYVTRVQKERFQDINDYENVKNSFIINAEIVTMLPASSIILHPLPRVNEISIDVDSDPRAKYFAQMKNGMIVRMALLAIAMGKTDELMKEPSLSKRKSVRL